jgi:hypothetical protein
MKIKILDSYFNNKNSEYNKYLVIKVNSKLNEEIKTEYDSFKTKTLKIIIQMKKIE